MHEDFSKRTRSTRVALIAALSGGATLAGETLGARLLRPVVGSTVIAQAGAVAGILGGLGLGAAWAARSIAKGRTRAPVVLARALLASSMLTVSARWFAHVLTVPSARALVGLAMISPAVSDLARTFLAVCLTLPFGVLAGATYPALAAVHGRGAGRATAVTGAASSFGASIAAMGVTFGIAQRFGLGRALWFAAALDLAALALARSFAPDDAIASEPSGAHPPQGTADRRVIVALAIAGTATSAWQFGLTRLGVLAFGPSVFALGAVTAAYTLSFGLGEATSTAWVDTARRPVAALTSVLFAGSIGACLASALAPHLPAWSASRFGCSTPTTTALWSAAFVMLLALVLPVAGLAAIALPMGARALGDGGWNRAEANARCVAAMAFGNVVGTLGGPLILLPSTSLATVLGVSGGALGLAAVVASWPGASRARRVGLAAAFGAVALALAFVTRSWDREALATGPFLYTRSDRRKLGRVVTSVDGRDATVVVRRDLYGSAVLQIDGKIEAASGGNTATLTLVGAIPALLCEHPRDVLVIGVGSGLTLDAALEVPGVERVDATELLPEVLDAARTEFAAANHAVLSRSNVRTIREDAALYLRGTRARYDLIVSQPSNPWVLGMADLFTAEAFAAARERLNSGGAMAVWFHAYSIDEATFAGIVSTFRAVFPASTLIEINSGQDYLLVGFVEPVSVDVDRLVARLADRAVTSRLVSAGIADRAAFFGRFVAGPRGVRAIADGAEVFHADDLRLEFRAPALLYTDASERIVALLDRHRNLPLEGLAPRGDAYRIVLRETQPLAGAMRGSGTAMVRPVAVRPSRTAIARENRECH